MTLAFASLFRETESAWRCAARSLACGRCVVPAEPKKPHRNPQSGGRDPGIPAAPSHGFVVFMRAGGTRQAPAAQADSRAAARGCSVGRAMWPAQNQLKPWTLKWPWPHHRRQRRRCRPRRLGAKRPRQVRHARARLRPSGRSPRRLRRAKSLGGRHELSCGAGTLVSSGSASRAAPCEHIRAPGAYSRRVTLRLRGSTPRTAGPCLPSIHVALNLCLRAGAYGRAQPRGALCSRVRGALGSHL